MIENVITIDEKEYLELVKKAERIATVERLLKSGDYVSVKEIVAVLGIDTKGGEIVG